ncbi:MAG TPA: methyltransferase domain-containing protein [Tepidisphaeraceae bacterium]|nr:methyltransferase domain-containing protein [Tepidisphaeraceae bacterium]
MDDARKHADDWSRPDSSLIAAQILHAFGPGRMLDVGSGMGALVQALLKLGIDAHGVDIAQRVVDDCNRRMPGRFQVASALQLPFADGAFDAAISTDCLKHIGPDDVPAVLREMARVSRGGLYLRVAIAPDRDRHGHQTVAARDEWERHLFEAGLRKHPRYYAILPYEELEDEDRQITIVAEKLPPPAAQHDPLESLAAERDLHMDMLRETGRRSDAHVARYQLAARFIRPGDIVLDAACGLGYGAYVMKQNSLARQVVGIDISSSAIEYARRNFAADGVEFRTEDLLGALAAIADSSFDYIASFETLEHVADPDALLAQFHRVLRPGGRLIVSVPNEWTDESGKDPNPHHLHVYTWQRIVKDLSRHFLVDDAWQQIASGCRIARKNRQWLPGPRRLRRTDPSILPDSEWCLLSGVKSPLNSGEAPVYRESVFANVAAASSPVARFADSYRDPWLVHTLVNIGYRMHSPAALEETARQALATLPPDSADAGAALCILLYRALQRPDFLPAQIESLSAQVDCYLQISPANPHVLRWQISLSFVMGRLRTASGQLDQAIAWYARCAQMDSLAFSPHLATKTAEAWYEAGRLGLGLARLEDAQRYWTKAMDFGRRLLAVGLDAVLVNPEYPNLFDHGDGMREFTLALDYLTRCANGLHLLNRQRDGYCVDWRALDRSFHSLAQNLQLELTRAQNGASALTGQLEATRCELVERTASLDSARADLLARTAEADQARNDLSGRTGELDRARAELSDRTKEADAARRDLLARTAEADEARRQLAERAAQLEAERQSLIARTAEVDEARRQLTERTDELDAARRDLLARTAEADEARRQLAERTAEVDGERQSLIARTSELNDARRQLAERAADLDAARRDLLARTAEVDDARLQLVARTGELDTDREVLRQRTHELDSARADLIHRTEELDESRRQLRERTAELESLRRTWWFKLHQLTGGAKS